MARAVKAPDSPTGMPIRLIKKAFGSWDELLAAVNEGSDREWVKREKAKCLECAFCRQCVYAVTCSKNGTYKVSKQKVVDGVLQNHADWCGSEVPVTLSPVSIPQTGHPLSGYSPVAWLGEDRILWASDEKMSTDKGTEALSVHSSALSRFTNQSCSVEVKTIPVTEGFQDHLWPSSLSYELLNRCYPGVLLCGVVVFVSKAYASSDIRSTTYYITFRLDTHEWRYKKLGAGWRDPFYLCAHFTIDDRLYLLDYDTDRGVSMSVYDAETDSWTRETGIRLPHVNNPRMNGHNDGDGRVVMLGDSAVIYDSHLRHTYTQEKGWSVDYDDTSLYTALFDTPWTQVGRYLVLSPKHKVIRRDVLPYTVYDTLVGKWAKWPGMVPCYGESLNMMVGEDGLGMAYVHGGNKEPSTLYSVSIEEPLV
ncbi:hypothetical protein KIPB_005563 [Kipferlia bialata]|uniref:Uncharacterized protein n=1 Tax=Kipferlia bialata TaxID=797122 RepID=A0A9K3CVT3_9EUKA|nr:hypothetical protein KIPB_005563 [Kipferlia bialata]|eukprot:g5563.t1